MPITNSPAEGRASLSIRKQLLRRIGRQWKPGARLPSIRDLASDLGSGYVNTHRAVQSLTQEGVLIARDRVGVFVAENFNAADFDRPDFDAAAHPQRYLARPLAGVRVHVVVPEGEIEAINARQFDAFEARMRSYHCDVTRCPVNMGSDTWRDLTAHDCEALAMFGHNDRRGYRVRSGTALVMAYHGLFREPLIEPLTDFDTVTIDHHHSGLLAGRHLRAAGVKSVCFIGRRFKGDVRGEEGRPDCYDEISTLRLQGFAAGFGAEVPPAHQLLATHYAPGAAARLVPQFLALNPRPQAVFAANDDLALGLIHGAQAHDLEPGRDYQIVGIDGQKAGRNLQEGPLTTVDIPSAEIGRRAADMLAERLLDPTLASRQFKLGCTLFRGNTVRPVQSSCPSA